MPETIVKTTVTEKKKNSELKKIVNETQNDSLGDVKKYNENVQPILDKPKIEINKKILKKYKNFWKLGNKDFNTQYFNINEFGELVVEEGNYQYNIKNLVEKYGSTLQIFFPFILRERINHLMDLFNLFIKYYHYKGKFFYHFPMKVNQNKEYLLSLVAEGANLEVASYNELCLVKKIWEDGNFNSDIRVVCNGPKTDEYLELIKDLNNNNLKIFPIIEHHRELEYFKNYKGDLGIRVDLNVSVSSRWDKKINRFGFSPEDIFELGKIRNLKVLHYHIGSQIEFMDDMLAPIKKIISIYAKIKKNNPSLDTLDIGGGMSIPYDRKKRYGAEGVIKNIIRIIQKKTDKLDIPNPNIICEWGQYITAPSQITIFKVIAEKDIPKGNAKKWYIIDGSFMNDLPDTWAISQKWHILPLDRLYTKNISRVWLGGSTCDSDDKYTNHGSYITLPKIEDIDNEDALYIAALDTGAYQDALGGHHCLLSPPVKIMAQNGETQIIRKRKSQDIWKLFGW